MEVIFADTTVTQFIARLDIPTNTKVLHVIALLEAFGPKLRMPQSKYIGHSLFELRIRGQTDIRLIYIFTSQYAVILHGFKKKSPKIPKNELNIALRKALVLDINITHML